MPSVNNCTVDTIIKDVLHMYYICITYVLDRSPTQSIDTIWTPFTLHLTQKVWV